MMMVGNALAILKPDHACLIPARLHQIGNCKNSCRHGSGVMPVFGRKLEGTFLYYQILTCFSPASSLFSVQTNVPSSFLQNSGANKQALSRHEQGNQTAKRRKNKQGLVRFRCDLVEQVSVQPVHYFLSVLPGYTTGLWLRERAQWQRPGTSTELKT